MTRRKIERAAIEIGFILFLFYSNLFMGEFTRSGAARHHGIGWALHDVFTLTNFAIGIAAALIGYPVAESLRKSV